MTTPAQSGGIMFTVGVVSAVIEYAGSSAEWQYWAVGLLTVIDWTVQIKFSVNLMESALGVVIPAVYWLDVTRPANSNLRWAACVLRLCVN